VAERLRRVPPALTALLAIGTLLPIVWACVTPAFQAPDEQSHFAYTQYLAERHALPGDPKKPIYSSEHIRAAYATRSDVVAAVPLSKPEWNSTIYDEWSAASRADRRDDGGGPTSASSYPPASYIWEAVGYTLVGGDFFDRLVVSRVFSALWLPVTVLATWLLAGELFARRRPLQLAAAAVPALSPMAAFISGSVNPDGMLYALWTLALWLGVRCLKRGLTPATGAAFAATVGLACVTKATSYALLPPALLVLAVGLWRARDRRVARVAAVLVPLALTLGAWYAVAWSADRPAAAQVSETTSAVSAGVSARPLLSYIWHFYVPGASGGGWPVFQVWIKQLWGAFGWLEVRFPVGVYKAFAAMTGVVGIGAAIALWRRRRRVDLVVVAFLATTVVCLLAGLHWTDFRLRNVGFMQGRYLLPLIGVFGCTFAAAVLAIPEKARSFVVGGAVASLFAVHVAAIVLVAARFYA
jgi:4-amino-4-deoxy-L-arabinose transferase-like glycosyltransferase